MSYRPKQVWGYGSFPAAGTQALAIIDLVSRKWIDSMLCPKATSLQVQVLFTRALDREGLLAGLSAGPSGSPTPPTPTQTSPSCSRSLTTGRR